MILLTFTKNAKKDLIYYTVPSFEDTGLVKHGFSTRQGGVSKSPLNTLNLGMRKNDLKENLYKNYKIFGEALGIPMKNMVLSDQVHGDKILKVGRKDRGKGLLKESTIEGIDGLVTDEKGVALVTFYADCVPLFLLDPVHEAIGLAHAGWKGTVKKIGGKTLEKMMELYGTKPEESLIAIGPSIGACCFEVEEEVISYIEDTFDNPQQYYDPVPNGKYMANLWKLNKNQFLQMGVQEKNITVSGLCTKCNKETFFSHRGDHGNTGSLAAIFQLK